MEEKDPTGLPSRRRVTDETGDVDVALPTRGKEDGTKNPWATDTAPGVVRDAGLLALLEEQMRMDMERPEDTPPDMPPAA